jgi:hypothetical protein
MSRKSASGRKATLKRRVVRTLDSQLAEIRGGDGTVEVEAPESAANQRCQAHSIRIGGEKHNHNQRLHQ